MNENQIQLTLGSLFDGIAGFPLAAAGLGIKTIWTSEIEANCVEIAARHFPEAKQLGDIIVVPQIISEMLLSDGCAAGVMCSVEGCQNEAEWYIDIPDEAQGPAEHESVWKVAADMLRGIGRRIVYKIRHQTPTECERLDGFPDNWTKYDTKGNEISDTARYTALGNSIAIPCAVRVFQGIVAAETEVKANADNDNQ